MFNLHQLTSMSLSADAPPFVPKLQIGEEDTIMIVEKKQEVATSGAKSAKQK